MGLFKWIVTYNNMNIVLAEGYVYAEDMVDATVRVQEIFNKNYDIVIIDDTWDFFRDEGVSAERYTKYKRYDNGVIVSWQKDKKVSL